MKYIYLVLLVICFSGCTPIRYQYGKEYIYTPPEKTSFENSRTYSENYDQVWKACVAVFAINNFQIKTMDKESGIIAAEAFYNPSDMNEMVSTGKTTEVQIEIAEKMKPSGFVGSGNAEYVKQYGTVDSRTQREVSRKTYDSKYPVTAFLNILVRDNGGGAVIINVNSKFQTTDRIGGSIPAPASNGKLESSILGYLDSVLTKI